MTTKQVYSIVKDLNKKFENLLENYFVNCLLALNDEYINPDKEFIVKDRDEISIIPPISAG
jgi:molybdopterin converting factor small subunit